MKTKRQNRKFLIINGLIAVIGLIIRLIAGFQLLRYDSRVADPAKVTDMWTYLNFAREILSGEVPREFYYQPFYYSVFLPLAKPNFSNTAKGASSVRQLMFIMPVCLMIWWE